ncbi:MAG TPA: glycosyltransferase family 39 protein [Solirubrobacteraceae bacterium]|jgi:mannosyltransferase|nr:glycosyltransferase family 39 protein [Solirubrobacteraceae bacterium]
MAEAVARGETQAGTGLEKGDSSRGSRGAAGGASLARGWALPAWWPLAALTLLAAGLRLGTLNLQSFWYDEAFTPVHVLHPGLGATLRAFVRTENTPPLWYVVVWAWSRVAGTGEVALRLPSALAGIATVPVAWGIGCELAGRGVSGRRAAILCAALVAFDPLFVWYSQEARAYAFFVLFAALALLCMLRADREPTPRRMALFALAGALALLSHYFAVFLLIPMALWLLRPRRAVGEAARAEGEGAPRRAARSRRPPPRAAIAAVAALALVGLALAPLIVAQGGHGTQWIGEWALSARLEAIPQYYLTGYSAAPLGHGIELLVALAILAAVGYGLWRVLTPQESNGALLALAIAACGVLLPLALALLGADYLAPRNLVAAMVPLSATIAVIAAARRTGRVGMALGALVALALLALSVDVDLSPRLQRGDWRGLAQVMRGGPRERVITTVELGAAPLEYYLPPLRNLARDTLVRVREIDETGYLPLAPGAGMPPAPGFTLAQHADVNGLILYRFRSPVPRLVSEVALRTHVITPHAHPEVLVPGDGSASTGAP